MKVNARASICFGILLCAQSIFAQQRNVDTGSYQAQVNNTVNQFKQALGTQSGLYNGQEYISYSRQKKDNAFFHDQQFFDKSTVTYDGITYTDVPVMYDLYRNVVAVQLYNKVNTFMLVSEKIKDFTLLNHQFVYKFSDSLNSNGLQQGIYDLLYIGKTETLVKRKKILLLTPGQQTTYIESNTIFIKFKGVYHSVGTQHSVLSLLKDKKKDLRKFINDNSIVFKDNEELATARIAAYYDQLTQ